MAENELLSLFPKELRPQIEDALRHSGDKTEEIRCRIGHPVAIIECGKTRSLSTADICSSHLDAFFERATSASVHAYEEEIRNGFLFTASGFRVGLCGTVYYESGAVAGIRDLTSVSIRIPHEVRGCADKLLPELFPSGLQSTLILSPPGFGKTTLLRELIRKLSLSGQRICVADERGEISASGGRSFGFDLGPNTDVMTGGRKGETAMMLLRAMNPQILAFDEITDKADLKAITQAAGCGAILLATAHAEKRRTLQCRALYREMLEAGIFEKAVWIQKTSQGRTYVAEDL